MVIKMFVWTLDLCIIHIRILHLNVYWVASLTWIGNDVVRIIKCPREVAKVGEIKYCSQWHYAIDGRKGWFNPSLA